MQEEAIVNGVFVIEKMDGKGGWHYVKLPTITKSNRPFGQVRVKGKIDTFEFKQYFLQINQLCLNEKTCKLFVNHFYI